ncbi:MAG: glycosyltransferase [Bacteroidetes bacterium HGW-Bacteroidetes-5]|jgi:glycosyltransferase involved in cell wall biosynthesis|nr:MAG: glycosyltransferase [Bacteroidetes bacterium HGW-Bacteroidetes-5]
MKGLFIHFFGLKEFSGISKKIICQIEALERSGLKMQFCYIDIDDERVQRRVCSGTEIDNFGNGFISKFGKWLAFKNLTNYIISNNIEFVYIRSFYNTNPLFLRMLSKLKRRGVKVVMEYPTYPYDKETQREYYMYKPIFFINRIFRRFLKGRLDRIVTFTNLEFIDGVKTINISNAIDFDSVGLTKRVFGADDTFNLLGVAEVHFWHGYDRVIAGLVNYYKNNKLGPDIHFHIVGAGAEADLAHLKEITAKCGMGDYVHFHGNRRSDELDKFFDIADFGIASLARHRTGITHIKTLKNREYAARGIPFIYSEIDEDFEHMPYILKATADESAIDINRIIEFKKGLNLTPVQIRESITGKLSWDVQMKRVVDDVFMQSTKGI